MFVTTRYPIPSITGPNHACRGESVEYTAIVDASNQCFHHILDWETPPGWTVSTQGNKIILNVPSSAADRRFYDIRSRVYYDDRNEFGDFETFRVWVGKPSFDHTVASYSGPSTMTVNTTRTFNGSFANGISSYQWIIPNDWSVISGGDELSARLKSGSSTGSKAVFQRAINGCGYIQTGAPVQVTSGSGGGGNNGGGGDVDDLLDDGSGDGVGILPPSARADDEQGPESLNSVLIQDAIYPNPVSDQLNIIIKDIGDQEKTIIYLYDLNGRLVYQNDIFGSQNTLNVAAYKSGTYLLTLENINGTTTTRINIQ